MSEIISFDDEEVVEDVPLEVVTPPRRIKTWQVVVFGGLIALAFLAGNIVAGIMIVVCKYLANPQFDVDRWAMGADTDAMVMAMCSLGGMVFGVPVLMMLARYQKEVSATEYVGLRPVSVKTCLAWVLLTLAIIALSESTAKLLGDETIPEWMLKIYSSEHGIAWLWFAVVIAAPISEELFFRGFLFTGLRTSWLGTVGTAVVTSFLWAVIHVQYEPITIGMIFLGGLVLSYARVRTNSVVPCLLMHMTSNLVASIEVSLVLSSQAAA